MRPYQSDACDAVGKAIADHKRTMLLAMATGTGKTFTIVNLIYRLMKAGVAKVMLLCPPFRGSQHENDPSTVYRIHSG
jgi:type I restriction enzyme R subunit